MHSQLLLLQGLGTGTHNCCSRTLHTYWQILIQLADSFKIDVPEKSLEKELIACAYNHIKERKTLYILIDEAHLLDMQDVGWDTHFKP